MPAIKERTLGDILIEQGVITPLELDEALQRQRLTGDMLGRIFRCAEPAGLTLVLLKNTDGEIGLKSGDNDFFGDIYVGDATKFIKIVEEHEPQINIEKIDHPSLFRATPAQT